jgi:hypothetical protein
VLLGSAGFGAYVGDAVALADALPALRWAPQAVYFVAAGLLWVLPARWLRGRKKRTETQLLRRMPPPRRVLLGNGRQASSNTERDICLVSGICSSPVWPASTRR